MTKFYKFKCTVISDDGEFVINTVATDEAAARMIVCNAEGCPDRAIKNVTQGEKV